MTSIFEGQPPKTRPFRIKTGVIWVWGGWTWFWRGWNFPHSLLRACQFFRISSSEILKRSLGCPWTTPLSILIHFLDDRGSQPKPSRLPLLQGYGTGWRNLTYDVGVFYPDAADALMAAGGYPQINFIPDPYCISRTVAANSVAPCHSCTMKAKHVKKFARLHDEGVRQSVWKLRQANRRTGCI